MLILFGKHRGKTVEYLVLREPDYVQWMLKQQEPTGPLARAVQEARRLIAAFDAKPVARGCCGTGCGKPATRCSLHVVNFRSLWWCDDCEPLPGGVPGGKLWVVKSYFDVVTYVQAFCHGRMGTL